MAALDPVGKRWQRGQGIVEYALILTLVALVVCLSLSRVGTSTRNVLNSIGNELAEQESSGGGCR